MKALDWLAALFGVRNQGIGAASSGEVFGRISTDTGMAPLNEQQAIALSAVYACVNLIAGAIAALPMSIYRRLDAGERAEIHNDPLWWLLNEEFHPRWPAHAGWERLVASKLLHGDAFALIQRRGPTIVRVLPLHPRQVEVYPAEDERLVYTVTPWPFERGGEMIVVDQDDMLHVPSLGFDGRRSPSPLRSYLSGIGPVAKAGQDFAGRFYANGARPDYAMIHPATLSPEQIENLRSKIDEQHGGVVNARRPMLLTGGLDIRPLTMPLDDVELLATRKFQVEEIARVYGVPPFMIGHDQKMTLGGGGTGAIGQHFVRYTLSSHLSGFVSEINRKFFRTAARFAEFDTTELTRDDMKTLFDAFRVGIGRAGEPGFMSQNEVRRFLRLPSVEGGDELNTRNAALEQLQQPAPATAAKLSGENTDA